MGLCSFALHTLASSAAYTPWSTTGGWWPIQSKQGQKSMTIRTWKLELFGIKTWTLAFFGIISVVDEYLIEHNCNLRIDSLWLMVDSVVSEYYLGRSFADFHCLSSGIKLDLLRSWFYRIALNAVCWGVSGRCKPPKRKMQTS